MRSIVFRTPGRIDLRSITIFGINAKPNSQNPIGYFGTGLKYAIAGCVRLGFNITLYQGGNRYDFSKKNVDFRGKDITQIVMTKRNQILWAATILPFTTELGKNWQPWQIFRELYANTLDEGGRAWILSDDDIIPEHNPVTKPDETDIVVEGEEFVQEFLEKDKTFLPEGLKVQAATDTVQWFDRPSQHIYYRGLRVMDLEKPSQLTYNILCPIDLTEDRTAKNSYAVNSIIAKAAIKSEDRTFIEKVITAPADSHERKNLHFEYTYETPSKDFLDTTESLQVDGEDKVSASATQVVLTYRPPPPKAVYPFNIDILIQAIRSLDWVAVQEQITQEPEKVISYLEGGWSLENHGQQSLGEPDYTVPVTIEPPPHEAPPQEIQVNE